MTYCIREANEMDLEPLSCLMSQLVDKTITVEMMKNRLAFVQSSPIDYLYVYESEGRVLGALGFRMRECIEQVKRYGEISVLVVDADAKRMGIGGRLEAFAVDCARAHDCQGTWLVSGLHRKEEAHIFYKERGYQTTGNRFIKDLVLE
ncbi:MAG: GNAT family N-acetyltransferase [Gorillibacterium sp.]|nr:GNAT family N-acetyltransferase [Gorillibacterium sp.]